MRFHQGMEGMFSTADPVKVGDKFKVEITNDKPCYIYVFGEETDGSSYVLFPYTEKHSPYCGITGTRLFPRDYSMKTDNIGNRDHIAVVITHAPINYNDVNQRLSSGQGTYANRLQSILGVQNVQFEGGSMIDFSADLAKEEMIGVVISIDKK